MSRIGKAPIPIPATVNVALDGLAVTVKGPKGELSRTLPDGVSISQDGDTLVVSPSSANRRSRERHGLSRTLVANMVEGVSQGFTRKLEIVGVGYRASVQGRKLVVSAGYSHPVEMVPPEGVTFAVENTTTVLVGVCLSDEHTLDLESFARACSSDADFIRQLVDEGLVQPTRTPVREGHDVQREIQPGQPGQRGFRQLHQHSTPGASAWPSISSNSSLRQTSARR